MFACEEFGNFLLIEFRAFGLSVGCVRARILAAFIGHESQPDEAFQNFFLTLLFGAFAIRVFKAQEKLSGVLSRLQKTKERGACTAQM